MCADARIALNSRQSCNNLIVQFLAWRQPRFATPRATSGGAFVVGSYVVASVAYEVTGPRFVKLAAAEQRIIGVGDESDVE